MGFELRDHTADVAVEATGPDLATTFAAVADGLAAAACDHIPEPSEETPVFEIAVAAEGREALLFDYLDQLIYERDVRDVLPIDNQVRIDSPGSADEAAENVGDASGQNGGDTGSSWQLEATYRGLPLDDIDARDIKAVTYSEMRIEQRDDEWRAYVVFDV